MKTIELFHKVRHVDVVRKSCVSACRWATPRAPFKPLVSKLINFTIWRVPGYTFYKEICEAFRCGEEDIYLSFWMGHPWGLLQTISD